MSFQSFMDEPKGYLKTHQMVIGGLTAVVTGGAVTAAAAVANPAHGTSIQYTHVSNVTMTPNLSTAAAAAAANKNFATNLLRKVGVMGQRSIQYNAAVGGNFPNLRILPWSPTDVTFMQLNATADFAITGPLQGCTVAVVSHGGSVWFFHANIATAGGVTPGNRATKRLMIRQAGAIVGVPAGAAYFFCEYGPGQTYNGWGMVWGRKRKLGRWKFYVHTLLPPAATAAAGAQGTTEDRKWADF